MNIKLKNLRPEQIESLKKQIAEYENEKENEKPKDAIDYENGWVVYAGEIGRSGMYFSEFIDKIYSIGLYRDTKEEAEKLLRKMQIEHRLRQWAKMCREKVDWGNIKQIKYSPFYDITNEMIFIGCADIAKFNNVYFTDKSVLQRAIKDIGEQNLIDNYFVEV